MAPSRSHAPFLLRHWSSSRPLSRVGKMCLTPYELSFAKHALAADSAASRTSALASPKPASNCGTIRITYGSKSRPRMVDRSSYASMADSRWRASFLFSRALLSVIMMRYSLSTLMPLPSTRPARPYAAPRCSGYFLDVMSVSSTSSKYLDDLSPLVRTRGGRHSAMAYWTVSEGVLSVASSRSITTGIFLSPDFKCRASAPYMMITASLTRSAAWEFLSGTSRVFSNAFISLSRMALP